MGERSTAIWDASETAFILSAAAFKEAGHDANVSQSLY